MEYIRIERDGNIAILRLDRPPVNAVDLGLLRDALEAVDLLSADEYVGAMVLTGTGRCFCAGLDLKVVPHYDAALQREYVELTNRVIADIFSAPMPTVAAINGPATAGGFILAMCCDYRLGATGEYPYGVTEARVGIPFPIATLEVLRQELSPPVFRRLMLTGMNHPPETALEWGIIDELVPVEQLLIRATTAAADLATLPRGPYNRIKRQVKGDAIDIIETVIAEGEPMLDMWITPEGMAGAVDMIERQKRR